ncbi:MAG TPA: multidrug efflux RND transporter permease subunit [Gemmatimonadales bacterium]|jgi:hydrophobe/amphiphile efflux-1 (HAE1) family protein
MSHPPENPAAPDQRGEYFFIRRPVFAGVISIIITILGIFALRTMPITRYPQITPPAVQVTAVYPGANAEAVAQAVAAPIEQQLSALNGLLYFKSSNSSDGVMNLQVYFDISRSQDLAAVDVQNAVKLAEPQLPQEVVRNGITITKAQTDILLVGGLVSDDPRYDIAYLNNYAKLYVEDELRRIPGVGNAQVFGGREFSMLLSLDPDKMAQLGITVQDVANAVREQNATNPAGRLGREPAPASTELTLPVTSAGRLVSPAQFDSVILRARPNGSIVRLGDVANVHLGSNSYDAIGRYNGQPIAPFLVYQRQGANALAVKELIVKRMAELGRNFPPGIRFVIPFDTTPFVRESIREVIITLLEAMALVTLVVFVFLQSVRATLIPVLAVPVSIVGTFLGLSALGFSINVLTLFALVLAIGIVVDDAIVVIENVERIMAEEHLSARAAADKAMRQVSGALIAIVIVLCAVFIPVGFVPGITGALYKQFAITVVIAVVLSGLVALTLTPALCAALLRHAPGTGEGAQEPGWARRFNQWFHGVTGGYLRRAGHMMDRPRPFLAGFAVLVVLAVILAQHVPGGFLPNEDKGFFVVGVQLPDAASIHRTEAVTGQVEQIMLHDPGIEAVVALVGFDLLTGSNQTNSATLFARLKPWDERGSKNSLDRILPRVNGGFFQIKEALAFAFNFPEVPGLGTTSGLELNLQARTGMDIRQFAQLAQQFVQDANQLPEVQGAASFIRTNVPQVYVDVDREAAQARGVGPAAIFSTLQSMLSTLYVNDFNMYGRTYRVQIEAESQFRQRPEDINRFYVRNNSGEMVPLGTLVRTQMRTGPSIVNRFNGFTSALVTGAPRPGRSSGEMLNAIDKLLADKYAPLGIGGAYSGQSYQERASVGQSGFVFGLGIIIVFLVLAALYESWSVPFAVLLGVPFGIAGAYLGIFLRGQPSDVYFQIGLITVVGLAAKNAILIVQFASELRHKGMSIHEAAVEAARERFRPILMTSFAFILGVSPLMIASGAGAASRHSLGTGVFAGMLAATMVGVFFIPLFFAVIRKISERGKATA